MSKTVVVTGAGAGVGRAVARAFADAGCNVGLVSRDEQRLAAAAGEVEARGARACIAPTDVADGDAVEAAAEKIERELGPIDIWVNDAMVTIFAPVHEITPEEFRRQTEVTYLGTVYGTMAALRRMRQRGSGTIVQVGSALSYRAIPLQAAYCGAKFAIRGFTDALRCELLHEKMPVHVCMVQLPAMNTPQFDWAMSRMPEKAQPVPPIYQPEIAADAVVFAAFHRRREIWLGGSSWKAIVANKIAPGLLDHYLAARGYAAQMRAVARPPDAPSNLFAPVAGHRAAHGSFDSQAKPGTATMWFTRNRNAIWAGAAVLGLALLRPGGSGGGLAAVPAAEETPAVGRRLEVEKGSMSVSGKKIAVLATDGVEQVELTEPVTALKNAGAHVTVISPREGTIQGMNHDQKGDQLAVDLRLASAKPDRFDALVLPGGVANPDKLRTIPEAVSFVRHFAESGKPIAAICHGPWTLIEAQAVKGKTMTSWPSLKTDLKNAGANWVDQEVVVDGRLVTSRKPDDIPAFNREMLRLFGEAAQQRAA